MNKILEILLYLTNKFFGADAVCKLLARAQAYLLRKAMKTGAWAKYKDVFNRITAYQDAVVLIAADDDVSDEEIEQLASMIEQTVPVDALVAKVGQILNKRSSAGEAEAK